MEGLLTYVFVAVILSIVPITSWDHATNRREKSKHAATALCMIFWPIGLPLMGLWLIIRLCYSVYKGWSRV